MYGSCEGRVTSINVGMQEAKSALTRLVGAVQSGEEVPTARRGEPVARLEPVRPPN